MRKKISFFFLMYFSLAFLQTSHSSEIISNFVIEQGTDNSVTGWQNQCFHRRTDCNFLWDKNIAKSGNRSLTIKGGEGAWKTTFKVRPGKIYRISFYVRTSSSIAYNPRAKFNAYLRNSHQEEVVLWAQGTPLTTSDGWFLYRMGDYLAPPGTDSLTLFLKLSAEHGDDSQIWFDDIKVSEIDPPSPPESSYQLVTETDYVIWGENAGRKVFLKSRPPGAKNRRQAIRISAAGGETEAFQLVVTPDSAWDQVRWTWTDFTGPQRLPKESITCYRVNYINITEPSEVYGRPGHHPDPLRVENYSLLQARVNNPFWFLMELPEKIEPGTYHSTLTIHKAGRPLTTLPLVLTVWDFSLPRKPSVRIDSNIWLKEVMNFERGDYRSEADRFTVAKRYYQEVISHRATCGPAVKIPVSIKKGHVTTDTRELEKHLAYLKNLLECKEIRVNNVLHISSSKNNHRWPEDAEWQGIKIFKDKANTILNPAFVAPFSEHVSQIMAALRRQECYGHPYIKFFDEADVTDTATINAVGNIAQLFKKIDSNIYLAASGTPHRDLIPFFDRWDFPRSPCQDMYKTEQALAAANQTAWIYNNSIPLQDLPLLRTRLFSWRLWQEKLAGAYNWWSITYWKQDPWTATTPNSGSLLYPPQDPNKQGPLTSLRWEMMRQGLEDYEYLYLLSHLLEKSSKESEPDQVVAAARYSLERVADVITRFPVGKNDQPYTLDPQTVEGVREEIAKSIETLSRRAAARWPERSF